MAIFEKGTAARIFYTIIFFLSVLVFPWWLSLLLGFLGFALFQWYWEAIVLAVLVDVLYGASDEFGFLFFAVTLFFFLVFSIVKERFNTVF